MELELIWNANDSGGCTKTRKQQLCKRGGFDIHIGINNTLKYFVRDHPKDKRRASIKSHFNDFNKIYF